MTCFSLGGRNLLNYKKDTSDDNLLEDIKGEDWPDCDLITSSMEESVKSMIEESFK